MNAWKILNARTFGQLLRGTSQTWFCALGNPLLSGSGLRGTILGIFHEEFILRRLAALDYWSPADIGGVIAGISPIDQKAVPFLRLGRLNLELLLSECRKEEELADAISNHNPIDAAVLSRFMPHEGAVAVAGSSYDAHSWMFELAFKCLLPVQASEIMRLYVPTPARMWILSTYPDLKPSAVEAYNSALGLEEVAGRY